MKISPITNQNYNTSFQAVNMKYYLKEKNNFIKYAPNHIPGIILTDIDLETAYGFMSKQDAIDTLNAIKPFAQGALEVIESMIKNLSNSD